MSIKAVAICGSPRLNGNTQKLLESGLDTIRKKNIDTELILLSDKTVKPCIACAQCKKNKNKKCVLTDDDFDLIFKKVLDADIFIIGSPVYFGCATSQITSFLHRAGYVARANGHLLKDKIGGPVVVARRAGQNFTYAQLSFFFTISGMIIPGSTYWNIGFGAAPGEILDDREALDTINNFVDACVELVLLKKTE